MKLWGKHKPKQLKLPSPEEVARSSATGTESVGPNDNLSKLTPEARAKLEAEGRKISEILKFAEENPKDASSILRGWLIPKDDN